ncbi:uncharacterized protein [Apostichopus japonicus]|uniref:uncharacterized protein isoform X2 n=1 Tax=Stichopus japonicus TaxID=307972 RepID=UPI003AB720BC
MSKHSLSLTMKVSVVLRLLSVTVTCMGGNSNADGHATTTVTVKPNENVCLKCPIRLIPGTRGIYWEHGGRVLFRDYARLTVDLHLHVYNNTCSKSYETLELVNASKSVNYAEFTCWNRSVLAATFEIDVKGIPSVKILNDNRMISKLLNVQPGSNETLQCDVNAAIAPFNVTWAINGTVNRTNTEEDDTHLTSNLSLHLIDSPLLITCQVSGQWIRKVFANISIIPDNVDKHTTDEKDNAFFALYITVLVLFLASIFTSVGLYRRMQIPYSIFYEQLDGGSLRDFMMTHYQGAREPHAASAGTGNQDFLQGNMKTELQELIYFASNINKGLCFLSEQKERPPIAWMPPETIFMQEYYQASDVWGYAVLLWELFSFGEIPLARVSDSEIEKQIRGGFVLQPLCCPGAVRNNHRYPLKRTNTQPNLTQ